MKNHLPSWFWEYPLNASTTMTTKDLRETLLATDGWVCVQGQNYDIKSKRIGPGVYRVSLVLKNPPGK